MLVDHAVLQEDILKATLFASLASSTKFSVFTQPEEWYRQYIEIIQVLGFSLQAAVFSNYEMHSTNIYEIVHAILAVIITEL
jgi:hypothetical protein